jgi:hypothetical protein
MSVSDILEEAIQATLTNIAATHKCHEKDREILARRAKWIGYVNVFMLALSSTGLVTVLISQRSAVAWVTTLITFLSLLFNVWQLQFTPEVGAAEHKRAAAEYLSLRNTCQSLLVDLRIGMEPLAVRDRYLDLQARLNEVTARSPATSPKSYQLTRGET